MDEYHKILTVWKRDPETKFRTLIEGEYACPEFAYLASLDWLFTEKVDGTNVRVMFDGNAVAFGGKTDRAQMPPRLLERLTERFPSALLAQQFGAPACLYGEGYGAKIQKGGGNYRPDQDFVLFDVRVGDWWLRREDVEAVAESLGCDVVPVVGRGPLSQMIEMVLGGALSQWGDFIAEGIVARPVVELFDRSGKRVITKLKYRDFPR